MSFKWRFAGVPMMAQHWISARTYVVFLDPVGFFEESKRLLYFVFGMYGEEENGCWQPWNCDRHQLWCHQYGACQKLNLREIHHYCKRRGFPGGTDISHIHRLGLFLGVQNSEFQYFWGFSEKLIFLGGMKILWIFLGGHHKIGLVWGSFLCILGSFLRSRYRIVIFFLGC